MLRTIAGGLLATMLATGALAEGQMHRVAVHVDENDPKVMNIALNNVANLTSYYEAQGDTVMVELVAYGPGLNMFVPGKSPVEDRISTMSLSMENLSFSACGNTLANMEKKAGKKVALMDEATVVPSGVVRLIKLQEQDYAYIRP
ncbi:DsrE family protein [Sulfitobacter sp. F26204]|uniref:DsrE family protein n=1 Tax=Sulfitobacter sp. F26204 TaxID=2996014 RepID=UPI00225DDA70|nr:DsrE family protein [Sulfitobacter sp. F26204]MCX7560391.1 DsrE family protein [Sulfitobacter sp. F26204]